MEQLGSLLPLLLILVVFYLLILRPARSRQREVQRLQSSLAAGQQVMTTGGLYGTVTAVQDDAVELEIAPGVTSRWAKGSIGRVVPAQDGGRETSAGAPGSVSGGPGADALSSTGRPGAGTGAAPTGATAMEAEGPDADGRTAGPAR